jgi:hypothetical protein
MICPHCKISVHADFKNWVSFEMRDINYYWSSTVMNCPECGKSIVRLNKRGHDSNLLDGWIVYPRATSRNPVPKEVPPEFGNDYLEACTVFSDSAKASAALSRRCLQNILREKAEIRVTDPTKDKTLIKKIEPGNLNNEIQQVLDGGVLPTAIAQGLDAVRTVGNFASHPIKSKSTGEIVEVEPGEAEWNLDVIESLFDYYFVQPKMIEAKRLALNTKLKDAGKPELK